MPEAQTPKYKTRQSTTRIILHDSHTAPSHTWGLLEAGDMGQRMGLLSVGYHYLITRAGEKLPQGDWMEAQVIVARPQVLIGSHTPGHNMDSIGVCLEGGRSENGDPEENIQYDQRKLLIRLCAELMDIHGKKLHVVGHSEVSKHYALTHAQCPNLDMDLLREDIELYQKGISL